MTSTDDGDATGAPISATPLRDVTDAELKRIFHERNDDLWKAFAEAERRGMKVIVRDTPPAVLGDGLKWISASDRLPRPNRTVIAFSSFAGEYQIVFHSGITWMRWLRGERVPAMWDISHWAEINPPGETAR